MATDTTAQQTIDVVTPAAGESVSEGTILEWHVKVGDFIKTDDTIVEISTDKVDLELPSPASGTVSEILVEEGDTVTVGQVIARISVNGATPAVETAEPVIEPTPEGAADGATRIVDVLTPAAGESVSEGTILEWRVKVGDFIKTDDTIVEISTDKVDLELPSPDSGTVSEILAQEGDTVTVGQVIARIAASDAASAPAAQPSPAESQPATAPEGTKVSPVAARAAAVEGVDLGAVSGSGPAGRITKSDVLSAAAGNGASTNGAATATTTTEPS